MEDVPDHGKFHHFCQGGCSRVCSGRGILMNVGEYNLQKVIEVPDLGQFDVRDAIPDSWHA